ncbi:MAG TPA: hypothetical protein DHN29_09640, partial [Cytophagales bacterium]|nr:hypothetical protein [Cytophagales bacterium]
QACIDYADGILTDGNVPHPQYIEKCDGTNAGECCNVLSNLEENCQNQLDDNGDFLIDCKDPTCHVAGTNCCWNPNDCATGSCVDNVCTVGAKGDLDGSGELGPNDAVMILQHATGKITLDEQIANLDCQAGVKANDAVVLLQKAVGKIIDWPTCGGG